MIPEKRVLSLAWRVLGALAAAAAAALTLSQPVAAGRSDQSQAPGGASYVTIGSISPSCGYTSGLTVVTLTGTGFVARQTSVSFGANPGQYVLVWSPTMLTVVTPAAAGAGAVPVTVTVPTGNAVYPAGFTYSTSCPHSSPAIAAVSPSKIRARTPTVNLTVTGSGFQNGATVTWNGLALATTFVNPTQLVATVVAADISLPGTAQIKVLNADGGLSGAWTVTIISGWQIVGAADFNHDGRADLVWESSDGYLAVWYMNGFTQADGVLLYPAPIAVDGWHVKAIGDLDGDGWPDLVWENTVTGDVAAWYMAGAIQKQAVSLAAGAMVGGWHVVAAGDLDADGFAEVIVQNDNGLIGAWFRQSPALLYPTPVATGGYTIVAAADVNNDGRADLIWQTPTGGVAVWLMNGASQTGVFVSLIAAPGRTAAIGDLDGDHALDLTFQSDVGAVVAYLMNPGLASPRQSGTVSTWVYSRAY